MSFLVVYMTAPTRDEARMIARALVEERLAACCSIVERVQSVYRWEGNVEEAEEWLVVIKTAQECFARLEARVAALHSYDTPELIALPVVAGSERYLAWLGDALE